MPTPFRQLKLHCILAMVLGMLCGCQSGPLSQLISRGEREPVIDDQADQIADSREKGGQDHPDKTERKRPRSIADRIQKKPSVEDASKSSGKAPPQVADAGLDTHKGDARPGADSSTKSPSDQSLQDPSVPPEATSEIQQTSGESLNTENADSKAGKSVRPISKTRKPPDAAQDEGVTPAENAETAASDDRWSIDAIKILPGKRDGRTFTERLNSAKLTPPWNRESASSPPPYQPQESQGPDVAAAAPPPQSQDPVRTDPKADYWQDELRKVISLMEAEAARPPEDNTPAEKQAHIQRQVYLRMLYLMVAEPEKAQLPLKSVDPVDQEFWSSIFWGMSNYFSDDPTMDMGIRASQTIAQLQTATRHLQALAELEIRNLTFCQRIDGWGNYEPFDRDEFDRGQTILLYSELRNFQSEQTATNYRTLVHSSIEIVRAGAEEAVLEKFDLGDVEDQCRGLRTDFYNSYQFTIPATLNTGAYRLRLIVEDQLSGKVATQTLSFVVR